MVPESLVVYLAWWNYKSLFSFNLAGGEILCLLLLSDTGMIDLNSPNSQGWQLGSVHSLSRVAVYSAESD